MSPPANGTAATRTREYTELDGGHGREIRYRAERHAAAELAPVQLTAQIASGDARFIGRVLDVSATGVALDWDRFPAVDVGSRFDRFVLGFDGHEAYRGRARVASSGRVGEHPVLGLALDDGLVAVDALLSLRDVRRKAASVVGVPASWRLGGFEALKAGVADLRLFLEDGRVTLDALEASLPPGLLREPGPARDALAAHVSATVSDGIRRALLDLDALSRGATPAEWSAVSAFSQRHLNELLMQSPWALRARTKPFGYPGDYEIMNGLYGNHFDGATLFGKAVNLAMVWMPAAEAVRTRKDLVLRALEAALERAPAGRPLRVLSVAAGPAEEIHDLLAARPDLGRPVEIVLFEQDRGALAYSHARLTGLLARRPARDVSLVLLHDSIKRLLLDHRLFAPSGQFDFVFSCGLADYLQRNAWLKLARTLYGTLAPGGELFIGNMVKSNPTRFMMDVHLDWPLVYRAPEELLELGGLAAPAGRVHLLEEKTGVNPLVAFHRD